MSGENREPQAEPEIGRSLERARQDMGLSLWQVEQETRIRSRYLRDLEREEFDVLPAVYVLGSLKTYADFLGLDGAALSRQLKVRLVRPAEPDVPAQLATLGRTPDEDDEYVAAPAWAIGFDQLFLGIGVILISILAVMTLVAAVAQGDESPISQVREPSTPEAPSEIALAGNVQDGDDGVENDGTSTAGDREDRPVDEPEAPRGDEEIKDEGEKDDGDASQASSPFGDAEFVPMSPSSSNTASASAAPASASPAPSSPEPATDASAATASTSAPSEASAPSATEAEGSGAESGSASAGPAPVGGAPAGPDPRGARPVDPDRDTLAGGITNQVMDTVSPLR